MELDARQLDTPGERLGVQSLKACATSERSLGVAKYGPVYPTVQRAPSRHAAVCGYFLERSESHLITNTYEPAPSAS